MNENFTRKTIQSRYRLRRQYFVPLKRSIEEPINVALYLQRQLHTIDSLSAVPWFTETGVAYDDTGRESP